MASLVHLRAEDGSIIRLEYHETCPSVAELARRYAIAGYPDRYVVVSERQTKVDACGRPLKADKEEVGVYISLILRPSMFPSQAFSAQCQQSRLLPRLTSIPQSALE